MHIDPLERKWIWISIIMVMSMIGVLTAYAIGHNIHPPSNVEPINSATLHLQGEFTEDNLGAKTNADGSVTVHMVAARYGFYPQNIEVPANTPVKIRIASLDVLHGVHGAMTNFSTMVLPGYVSEVNTEFPNVGVTPLFCNEYCGLGHDYMWAKLTVVEKKGAQ